MEKPPIFRPASSESPTRERRPESAPGGAYSYVINGRMIAGFAMVAYPAEYGNTGVMTFIVSHDGIVYEKDLGPDTAEIVKEIVSATNTGPATTILSGLSVGMESSVWALLVIVISFIAALLLYSSLGAIYVLYAVAMIGIGMLSHTGNNVAMDSYGPISDNANGIGEMAWHDLDDEEEQRDAAGVIGRGVAVAAALELLRVGAHAVGDLHAGVEPRVVVLRILALEHGPDLVQLADFRSPVGDRREPVVAGDTRDHHPCSEAVAPACVPSAADVAPGCSKPADPQRGWSSRP